MGLLEDLNSGAYLASLQAGTTPNYGYTAPQPAVTDTSYQWQSPGARASAGQGIDPSLQPYIDAAAAAQARGDIYVLGKGYVPADQYDWRMNYEWANDPSQTLGNMLVDPNAHASQAAFTHAWGDKAIASDQFQDAHGFVERLPDGTLWIDEHGGIKDGVYHSPYMYNNGKKMGRFTLSADQQVRLTDDQGNVAFEGNGLEAGPKLFDSLIYGMDDWNHRKWNVQQKDANGNWTTVVKGDPGPGLLGNFLTAAGIVGGAVLGGHLLLPALGAGGAGGAAAGAAGAGAGAGGAGAAAAGAGLGAAGAAGAGAGLGIVGTGGLITVMAPAAAAGLGTAGAIGLGGLAAGGLAAGLASGSGAGSVGAGAGAGTGGSSGATGGLGALPADIVVTAPAAGGGIGTGTAVGGLGALGAGGVAASGAGSGVGSGAAAGAGNTPSPVSPDGTITVTAPTTGTGTGTAIGGGAAAVGAGAAAGGAGSGVVDPVTGDIVVTGTQGAPVGGLGAGGVAAGVGAGAAAGAGSGAGAAGGTSTLDQIANYLQLGALGSALLGNLFGGGGSGSGNGTIPGGLGGGLNPTFNGTLPPATNIPGGVGTAANFGPRTMPEQDWNRYAMQPEQSFFRYVPQTYTPPQGGLAALGG